MKSLRIMLVVGLTVMAFTEVVFANEHVSGYYRHDGTYVHSYERTDPNGTTSDNWSHEGNVNPITGEEGHSND
ncbi:hypothetical protein [Pectinatus frisingensis]|uniref:hypothetical protein n=1 Tax=Pectinatus frisingensis TaxID=865 RepID=UPI0018C63ED1|nr:hypothetical protein [Pectinatus frisingensis]